MTVALDVGGADAARPYIEAAQPQHPALIDRAHLCDDLLGIVNVPSSVWIDEKGTIVRPAEPAWPGSTPVLDMLPDLTADVPPERKGVLDEIRRFNIAPDVTAHDAARLGRAGSGQRVRARARRGDRPARGRAASTRPPPQRTSSSASTSTATATTTPPSSTGARPIASIRPTGRTSVRRGTSRRPTPPARSRPTGRAGCRACGRSGPSSTTRRSPHDRRPRPAVPNATRRP